jgi:cytoskeleton protein RodZ
MVLVVSTAYKGVMMDSINGGKAISALEKVPEPGQEAVQDLKAAREAQGLSLNDIFTATRVSLINLIALENQEFNRLPPPVYARDYIRKYAFAVGIDAKPLLTRYERYLQSLKPPPEETEVRKPWPESGIRYRFLFLTLGAVIVAGVLVYALFLYDQSRKTDSPVTSVIPPAATVEAPAPAAPETPAPPVEKSATLFEARERAASPVKPLVVATPPPPAVTGKNHQLVIEARELTWVRITQDGTPRQVLLNPGERIERSAADYFLLDIGNANGISVTYQGKPLGSLGKPGEVVHIRLPQEKPSGNTP